MRRPRRSSPARPRSTASARPATGRAIGSAPTPASARRQAGPTGADSRRTMPQARSPRTFVDRHDLWTGQQRRAAATLEREIKQRKLEVVRFAFADQHGVLRGKTLTADAAI